MCSRISPSHAVHEENVTFNRVTAQRDFNKAAQQCSHYLAFVKMLYTSVLNKSGLPYHSPLHMQGLGGSGRTRQRLLKRDDKERP